MMGRTAPIWKFGEVNPLTPEFKTLKDGEIVSFMPLEAVWPSGRADYAGRLPWSPKLSYTQFRRGDVLIPKITPTFEAGRTIIAEIDTDLGLASTEVHVVRNRENSDSRYLQYCFQSRPFLDEGHTALQGVGNLRRISPRFVQELRVLNADLSTQKRIADYLDCETGEIDSMIAKMDQLANRMRERAEDVPILFGLGEDPASEEEENSPLYGIPKRWSRTKFGYDFDESKERNGANPPGPLLSISEFRGVELNTRSHGQQASLDVSKYRVVRPNQLAANMMWLNHGGLGVSELTGYVSPDYKAFRISKRFDPRYVHYLFRSSRYVDYFQTIGTGVRPNAQRVTKIALDMMPVPCPPLPEQKRIADHLDEVTSRMDQMLAKVAELKSLLTERRAALITEVVTGRKEVA